MGKENKMYSYPKSMAIQEIEAIETNKLIKSLLIITIINFSISIPMLALIFGIILQ